MSKKILVFLGHPHDGSFCAGLAEAYAEEAGKHGAEVRLVRLAQLKFNPAVTFKEPIELEPDIAQLQADFIWAEHLVFVYPIWWGALPGLMKCVLERVLLTALPSSSTRKGSVGIVC